MNTAVPGTRTGFSVLTMARNASSVIARAVSRSATSRRPVFHVVINVKSTSATASVHPAALHQLEGVGAEERQIDVRKNTSAATATGLGQRQRSVSTTYSSSTVITIVSATAMP